MAALLATLDLVLPAPLRLAAGSLAGAERALVAALAAAAGLLASGVARAARTPM